MHRLTSEVIAGLGAERAGLLTHAEVVSAGCDPSLPSREVRAGRWRRLAPGIYLPSAAQPDERQLLHAACLHAGPESIITGAAGCVLREIAGIESTGKVTVLVPHRVRRTGAGFLTVIRARELPDWQFLRREGHADLRVALRERCVADAIRDEVDLASARAIAARARRDRDVDWALAAELAVRPGPGTRHAKRVVQDIADGVRSPAEGDLNDVLLRASRRGQLPPYLMNPDVYVDGVLIGSPDAWFVGLGLGDEQDSREWHGSEDGLESTLLRHERFRNVRLHLNHATPARFAKDPRAHVGTLQRLVAERRALAAPEPPGLVVLGRGPLLPARTAWPQVLPTRPR